MPEFKLKPEDNAVTEASVLLGRYRGLVADLRESVTDTKRISVAGEMARVRGQLEKLGTTPEQLASQRQMGIQTSEHRLAKRRRGTL